MTTAICPGSFDPVTVGHVDIIRRARKMFDHVIVAVLVNPTKNPSFSLEERIGLLKRATKEIDGLEIVLRQNPEGHGAGEGAAGGVRL